MENWRGTAQTYSFMILPPNKGCARKKQVGREDIKDMYHVQPTKTVVGGMLTCIIIYIVPTCERSGAGMRQMWWVLDVPPSVG